MTRLSRRRWLEGAAASALGMSMDGPSRAADDRADVLVLGAGISGLHAARLLQRAGLDVLVLEGSGRIGGRCWTAYDVVGHPELGASQVHPGYARVMRLCEELAVEIAPPAKHAVDQIHIPGAAISIGGRAVERTPWSESPSNRLSPAERSWLPMTIISRYCAQANPLKTLDDWLDPRYSELDDTPLDGFLKRLGASPEALRLANVGTTADTLADANTLDTLRKEFVFQWYAARGSFQYVKNGTSAITTALAGSLRRHVMTGRTVSRVEVRSDEVNVRCIDGSTWRSRAALCTFPFSTLRDLEVDGAVPPIQRTAWRNLKYQKAFVVHFRVLGAFWEDDGLPPTTWSDGPTEYAVLVNEDTAPPGLLMAHINGNGADRYAGLSRAAAGQQVLEEFVRIRPSARGRLEVVHVQDWTHYPFCHGHIAYFRPGDVGRFALSMGDPAGRLFFAGEHLAREHLGLEGACESAERAVSGLLARLT